MPQGITRDVARAAVIVAIVAVTSSTWLGCAPADGRRTAPSRLTLPGAASCAAPASAPALRASPAASSDLLVGIHSSLRFFTGRGLCRLARASRAVGAQAVREDFRWSSIQRRRGSYDWTVPDRVAITAARWGLILVPVLGNGTPSWARHERAASYASFVAATVRRYAPGGTFWRAHPKLAAAAPVWFELWNEPYEPTNPQRLSVRDYADLVKRAVPAGRAASTTAKFLVAGEYVYRRDDGSSGNWTKELHALLPDLATLADAISVHAYGDTPAPFDRDDPDGQVARVEAIHDDLVSLGAGGVPLWITESGWSTCSRRPECVSAKTQASNLDRLFTYARTRWKGYVRALIVYALQDNPGAVSDKERSFGLIRADGTAKPARTVYARRAGGTTPRSLWR